MTTAQELDTLANVIERLARNAAFGGGAEEGVVVTIGNPDGMVALLRKASAELTEASE